MTIKKAMNTLKNQKYLMQRDDYEANEIAVKMLWKEMEKHPEYDPVSKSYSCRECGYSLENFEDEYGEKWAVPNYCPSCGQKIEKVKI